MSSAKRKLARGTRRDQQRRSKAVAVAEFARLKAKGCNCSPEISVDSYPLAMDGPTTIRQVVHELTCPLSPYFEPAPRGPGGSVLL